MTKKDYQLIADVFKAHQDGGERDMVVRGLALSLAIELQKDNPRFNKAMFIKACTRSK
jgi:hypothetical protein